MVILLGWTAAINGVYPSGFGVIVTIALRSELCATGGITFTLVNFEIAFGAICCISYVVNCLDFIFCGGAWLEAFIMCWLVFLEFLVGMGFVIFFSL